MPNVSPVLAKNQDSAIPGHECTAYVSNGDVARRAQVMLTPPRGEKTLNALVKLG
ncbi:hypothetical protein GLOTRDRAFT_100933 [Gloeophyllum trabeum ATCC 11539]|uniref:Uncharacterized protein n=1 Tax=Gloeophyllum trabeum (strain ATCC 11539 / FP-39264 / Madison 617) TaxID=670483 RepID=S7Q1I5_GLOTA|nr:uncharacterized protein GLOTRDRAFT_100933 [Gloeophyllum trabeum ATCC 11539]EPQ53382.1 hypothetical protein GLOTRDRAFT_100933 [Gloeophyllum trabeum ATCC 11539]